MNQKTQQDDSMIWQLPLESEAISRIWQEHPNLKEAIDAIQKRDILTTSASPSWRLQIPKALKSTEYITRLTEIRKGLISGLEAHGSMNWFHRLSWAIRTYAACTVDDSLDSELWLNAEIYAFHRSARLGAAKLAIISLADGIVSGDGSRRVSTARLFGYQELSSDSPSLDIHRPLFGRDRAFVHDSIVFTVALGGCAVTLDGCHQSRLEVDDRTASKLYKNWVKGAVHFSSTELARCRECQIGCIWPGFCGYVEIHPLLVFYEPLLAPNDPKLKVRPLNVYESETKFAQVAAFIYDQPESLQKSVEEYAQRLRNALDSTAHGLGLKVLPTGSSDVTRYLCAEKESQPAGTWSTDCRLMWLLTESEVGSLCIRNMMELLPPYTFSESFRAIKISLGISLTGAGDPELSLEDLSKDDDMPRALLRRCPATCMQLAHAIGSDLYWPTYAARGEYPLRHPAPGYQTVLQLLWIGLSEEWLKEDDDLSSFRRWIRSLGLKTTEMCELILASEHRYARRHAQHLAEMEMQAKSFKVFLQEKWRHQYLSKTPLQSNRLAIPSAANPGNALWLHSLRPLRSQLVARLLTISVTNISSIGRSLEQWLIKLNGQMTHNDAGWWMRTVGLAASKFFAPSSLPSRDTNHINAYKQRIASSLADKAYQTKTMDLISLRCGILLGSACSQGPRCWLIDKGIASLTDAIAALSSSKLVYPRLSRLLPKELGAAGRCSTRIWREARTRYNAICHARWRKLMPGRVLATLATEIDVVTQEQMSVRTPSLIWGAGAQLARQAQHRGWPCDPMCGICCDECPVDMLTTYHSSEVLIACQASDTQDGYTSDWFDTTLSYGYILLSHGHHVAAALLCYATMMLQSLPLPALKSTATLLFEIGLAMGVSLEQSFQMFKRLFPYGGIQSVDDLKVVSLTEHKPLLILEMLHTILLRAKDVIASTDELQDSGGVMELIAKFSTLSTRIVASDVHGTGDVSFLVLLNYRLQVLKARIIYEEQPSIANHEGVINALGKYIDVAKQCSMIDLGILGTELYYYGSVRALSMRNRQEPLGGRLQRTFDTTILGRRTFTRGDVHCDATVAEVCWIADSFLSRAFGPLSLLGIMATNLVGEDLINQSTLLLLKLDQQTSSSGLPRYPGDYLFDTNYQIHVDTSVRELRVQMSESWASVDRRRLIQAALEKSYTSAYRRIVHWLWLKHGYGTEAPWSGTVESTPLQPLLDWDTNSENMGQLVLKRVIWNTLLANALCLSETLEIVLLHRYLSQRGTFKTNSVLVLPSEHVALSGGSFAHVAQSFAQEEYLSLREFITEPVTRTECDAIIEDCARWCGVLATSRLGNMTQVRTPTEWFTRLLSSAGINQSEENSLERQLIHLFVLIRASHVCPRMKAKWLCYYITAIATVDAVRMQSAEDIGSPHPSDERNSAYDAPRRLKRTDPKLLELGLLPALSKHLL